MLLIHDIVEIDAGDTFNLDPEAEKIQALKEAAAAKRIFSLLPQDQSEALMALWKEFDAGETAEAAFARAVDRIQPVLLHEATAAIVWAEKRTVEEQILRKLQVIQQATPAIWPKVASVVQKAKAEGKLR